MVSPLFGFALLWFVTAPDLRYFGPLAWLFAIVPALVWISSAIHARLHRVRNDSVSCAVPLACFAWENRWIWITRERVLPQIPVVELEVSTNRHGLAIWYAREGNKAFDAPLPSSWGFTPSLCLLDPPRVSPEASNMWNLEWYPAWSRIYGQNRARQILRNTPRLLERHEIPGHLSVDRPLPK